MDGFGDLLRSWWIGYRFNGTYSYIPAAKLKALKANLKVWKDDVFDNVSIRKEVALNKVGFWDAEERVVVLNAEEIKARRAAGEEFPAVGLVGSGILETEVQRNFVEGRGEGDRNTKFLHKMAMS